MRKQSHIGVIPARKNSKGVPEKNRYLFGLLADFITDHKLFDRVIVTTDDEILLELAASRGFECHRRPDRLADDTASIKQAFEDLVDSVAFDPDDHLWLLFIPLVYRNIADFHEARKIVDQHDPSSFCSFMEAASHPYACWSIDRETGRVKHFIENDLYNRQDFPEAWENYNYLCSVKVRELPRANANLITADVHPYLMSPELANKMVEIDEPRDLRAWRFRHPGDYEGWAQSQAEDCPLLSLEG